MAALGLATLAAACGESGAPGPASSARPIAASDVPSSMQECAGCHPKVVREFQHLQMYRTTAILTSRGITIHKALLFSMDLLAPADRDRLRAGLLQMHEGVAISAALSSCGLSYIVATSMLAVAERSGALPEMLDRIADFYERSLQRNIDIASRLIEPLLMIIFGFVIGGIVVLMYLPIFDLASSIS